MRTYITDISRSDLPALYDLRGEPAGLAAHLGRAGLTLPPSANSRLAKGSVMLLWIGPRRVLLLEAERPGARLARALDAIAADPLLAATDISDVFVAFVLSGPNALDILAQATPLDIASGHFGEDAASFTEVFGQTGLVMRAPAGFIVLIERSYADYMEAWLRAAAGNGR